MKKMITISLVLITIGLSSCARMKYMFKQTDMSTEQAQKISDTSNILASRVFYGADKTQHIAGGKPLFDYLLDEEIGQYMDWQDIINMQDAVLQTPVHSHYAWTNKRRHVTYIVHPMAITYNSITHEYCRYYEMLIKVKHQIEKTSGRVCHEVDGRWHVV
jgi:surface antigen